MKYTVAAICIMLSVSTFAQDKDWGNDRGWFVGVNVGQGKLEEKIFRYGGSTGGSSDDSESLVGAVGGFQFNRFVGVEAGYTWFGELKANDGVNEVTFDVEGLKLMAYGRWPATKRFSLVGKLGTFVSITDKEYNFNTSRNKENDSVVSLAVEAGMQYKLTPNLALSLEYGMYSLELVSLEIQTGQDSFSVSNADRDIRVVQAGLKYRF